MITHLLESTLLHDFELLDEGIVYLGNGLEKLFEDSEPVLGSLHLLSAFPEPSLEHLYLLVAAANILEHLVDDP